MLGQDTVQKLCRGMERKAQMPDLTLCLPLERMFDQMLGLNDTAVSVVAVVPARLEVVEQIVVDIVHAELIELMLEIALDLVLVAGLQQEGRELRGDADAFSRVPLHHGLSDGFLAFAIVVNKRGVEIVVPGLQIGVHHPVEFVIVKVCGISIFDRQSHHAKTEC